MTHDIANEKKTQDINQIENEIRNAFPEITIDDFRAIETEDIINGKNWDSGHVSKFIKLKYDHQSLRGQIERSQKQAIELQSISEKILKDKDPCLGFNLEHFPYWLRRSIKAKSESTDAHPITIASSTIATISGFIGKRCYIPEGEYFQKLYSNLWELIIQVSGGFKTTALNKGASLAHKKQREIRDITSPLYQELKATATEEYKKDLIRKIQAIEKQSILLPNRMTGEALIEHLSSGHGGVIFASELGEWLVTLEKSFNADLKGLLTDFYDVPLRYNYMTRTRGSLTVTEPFISICGVSTIDWIKRNLKADDVSSGFFARFLIFIPPKNDQIPPALPLAQKHYDAEAENHILQTFEHMDDIIEYKLNYSCKMLFEQKHQELYQIVKGYNENCQSILAPFLKRWSPALLKIAMIMQLLEDPYQKEIHEEALVAAWSFLEPAIKSTALLFDQDLGESIHQRKCRKVKEYLAKKGGRLKRRDLLKSKVLEGATKDYDDIICHLKESGEIIEIPNTSKDKIEYELTPSNAE